MSPESIELLAPAKNYACGVAAIEHGADAVYIGAPRYSARAAASNDLEDIERLIGFAHQFYAKVYIALNTLLDDAELNDAVALVHRFYEMRADAVIIQDMGLLECDLPPIPLHASTQVDNRTAAKVRFLEKVGFQQVVLARELSLKQIEEIAGQTNVRLECFVHGSLCVSYSGRCYMSEVMAGRSANRGRCAQICRHSFSLHDADGVEIIRDKHLLSLQDLNLSNKLGPLLEAGIRSFKIEGRLKDIDYVKNITALYRCQLDTILEKDERFVRASSGKVTFSFQPDGEKSFHRGFTSYYFDGRKKRPGSIDTPKSVGEKLGAVGKVSANTIEILTGKKLNNGDGLCYFDAHGVLVGFRVNRVMDKEVFPHKMVRPGKGTEIYRNSDAGFARELSQSVRNRKIDVDIRVAEVTEGLQIEIHDEDGVITRCTAAAPKMKAEKAEMTLVSIDRQVRKSGDTIFRVMQVGFEVEPSNYYPPSLLKKLRRDGFEQHRRQRIALHAITESTLIFNDEPWCPEDLGYVDSISNAQAERFYRRHGAKVSQSTNKNEYLMTCKYCIKEQLHLCSIKAGLQQKFREPWTLCDGNGEYQLLFDCKNCEMIVKKVET